MPVYAWAALGVFLAAILAGVATAATSGLQAWRTFRHFRRAAGEGLGDVLRGVAAAENRVGRLGEAATRAVRAREQLQESLAVAAAIAAAAGDARPALRLLGFLRR